MKNLLILYLALIPIQFFGQGVQLSPNTRILVQKNSQILTNPFAGGMNSTQFESVDLSGDGLEDLVTFDRTTEKTAVYVKTKTGYLYDPVRTSQLPRIEHWMRFVDYDADGKKDLFCAAPAGIQVFRNTSRGTFVSFTSSVNPLYTEGFSGKINLYVSNVDIPAIADIDGDGDIDVLAFDPSGHYVEFHQNQFNQSGKTLDFKKIGDCWGDFVVRNCTDIYLGTPCSADLALESVSQPSKAMHSGNTLQVFFHAGVPDLIYGHIGCPDLVYLTNKGTRNAPKFVQVQVGFPKPLNMGTFLNASFVDVDGDLFPELIATLSSADNNGFMQDFQQSNVLFSFVNGKWEEKQIAFLQQEMIDVGERASPCFWDADQDGDLDLLVSNAGIRDNFDVKASITYFKNESGKYVFVTSDYLNFKDKLAATSLLLQDVDWDNDGRKDLIISGQTDQGPRVYVLLPSGLKSIDFLDLNFGEIPVLVDWNQDSKIDLLILERSGRIRTFGYPDWGKFSLLTNWRLRSFSMADLDGNGTLEFVGIDQEGFLHLGNFDSVTNEIKWTDQNFEIFSVGRNAHILCVDFTADGKKDIVVGTGTGGILLFQNESESPIWGKLSKELFQLWPNPVADYWYVQTKSSGEIFWYDVLGRLIEQRTVIQGEVTRFETKGYGHGAFLLVFQSNDGKMSSQKFIIR
jgi:hypothetical protein